MVGRSALLAAVLALAVLCLPGPRADDLPEDPLPVGARAPDFTIPTLEGGEVKLSSWQGHVVVLNYFITWYRDAARHLGLMEQLATRYSPRGVRMLSISLDEGDVGRDATRTFVAEHEIAHAVAADPQQQVSGTYGVRALPAIFVIGADGKIAAYHEGYMEGDDERIESIIVSALDTQTSEVSGTETGEEEDAGDEEPVCNCFKQKDE